MIKQKEYQLEERKKEIVQIRIILLEKKLMKKGNLIK